MAASWRPVDIINRTAVFKNLDGNYENYVLINKQYVNGNIGDTDLAKIEVVNLGQGQAKSVTQVTPTAVIIDPIDSQRKVTLNANGLTFNVNNTKTVTFNEDTPIYNKICADVFVFGGPTDYSIGIRSIRGGRPSDRTWLYNLFTECPPIYYAANGNHRPSTDNLRVTFKYNGQSYNKTNTEMTDEDLWGIYADAMALNNSHFGIQTDGYPRVCSLLPTGIDEIELNIFVHDYDDEDIAFVWTPLVATRADFEDRSPFVKVNIHIDNTSGGEQIYTYLNKNYTTTGDPEYTEVGELDWNECIYLTCTPTYSNDGTVIIPNTSDDISHPWGWWLGKSI